MSPSSRNETFRMKFARSLSLNSISTTKNSWRAGNPIVFVAHPILFLFYSLFFLAEKKRKIPETGRADFREGNGYSPLDSRLNFKGNKVGFLKEEKERSFSVVICSLWLQNIYFVGGKKISNRTLFTQSVSNLFSRDTERAAHSLTFSPVMKTESFDAFDEG